MEEDGEFRGLQFQSKEMKMLAAAYPEFMCIDATYKLLDIRAPVYIFLVEDSNGGSDIICITLLMYEDSNSLKWMCETFKSNNQQWSNIKTIMTDKDIKERFVLKECFPEATLLICKFHVLKTFQRQITSKLGITSMERNLSLSYVEKLLYSKNLDEEMKD